MSGYEGNLQFKATYPGWVGAYVWSLGLIAPAWFGSDVDVTMSGYEEAKATYTMRQPRTVYGWAFGFDIFDLYVFDIGRGHVGVKINECSPSHNKHVLAHRRSMYLDRPPFEFFDCMSLSWVESKFGVLNLCPIILRFSLVSQPKPFLNVRVLEVILTHNNFLRQFRSFSR